MVSSSALAVVRLSVSSNLVGPKGEGGLVFLIFLLLLELGPLRPLLGHVEPAPALGVTGGGGRYSHALRGVFAVFGGFGHSARSPCII